MKDLKDLKGPVPSPYFANRILAHEQAQKQQKQVFIWKMISGFSLVMGCLLGFYFYNSAAQSQPHLIIAPVNQGITLQLDQVPQDNRIMYVSLEIDSEMSFSLTNKDYNDKKEITLAISSLDSKTARLPFVFLSKSVGKKNIRIKFLDSEFNLVKEDQHSLEFVETNKEKTI